MVTQQNQKITSPENKRSQWFDDYIASLRTDQLMLEKNVASKQKAELYDDLITGNVRKLFSDFRDVSFKFYVEQLVNVYVKELKNRSVKLNKLSFDLRDSRILVWAEIKQDDDNSENGLILSEGKVNFEFQKEGLHLSTTIIEDCDNVLAPPHYVSLEYA